MTDREPWLMVYNDYSCDVVRFDGQVETYDLLTPVDWETVWVPQFSTLPINPYGRSVERRVLREAKVSFGLRERPQPPDLSIPPNIILGGQDA